jgi:hypothetical protein
MSKSEEAALVAKFQKMEIERKKYQERKSKKVMAQFEEGVSILIAPKDEEGRRRIKREKFLDVLTSDINDALEDKEFTAEEMQTLRKSFSKRALAPGSVIAMRCQGQESCPYAEDCELAIMKKAPKGKKCPYETALFAEFLAKAVEELDVDPSNSIEMDFCNELATTDLLIMRMDSSLAMRDNVDLMDDQVVFDKQGNELTNKVVSPYLDARERLLRRRDKIVNLMVGDRKEKYKKAAALKLRDEGALSIKQSNKANKIIEATLQEKVPEKDIVTPDDLLDS